MFWIFTHRVKKISSGQVKKYHGQRWVGLLFTVGQKYARVGSGLGPSLLTTEQYVETHKYSMHELWTAYNLESTLIK